MAQFEIKDAAFGVDHDPQGRFWNSRWNLHEAVLAQYALPKTVSITDSTIREGEEAPHVVYSLEDKLRITRQLDEFGIPYVEGGWPGANPCLLTIAQSGSLTMPEQQSASTCTRYATQSSTVWQEVSAYP